jgi:hypothetical protein
MSSRPVKRLGNRFHRARSKSCCRASRLSTRPADRTASATARSERAPAIQVASEGRNRFGILATIV